MFQTELGSKIRPDLERTGRSKEAVERLGYLAQYTKKKMRLNILITLIQIAIIDSDIHIRPCAMSPNIFDDLSQEYAFGAVVERDLSLC